MKNYHDHPAYDDAIRHAVKLASQYPIGRTAGAGVFYYPAGNKMIAINRDHPEWNAPDKKAVCYAQRWDDKTIEVRFSGANSEFTPDTDKPHVPTDLI